MTIFIILKVYLSLEGIVIIYLLNEHGARLAHKRDDVLAPLKRFI